jgi:hypothetical protein
MKHFMKFSQERTHSVSPIVLFFQFYGFERFLVRLCTKKTEIFNSFQVVFSPTWGNSRKNNTITLCDTVTTPGETFVKMWDKINENYLHPFL